MKNLTYSIKSETKKEKIARRIANVIANHEFCTGAKATPEEIEEKMKYIRPSTGAPPEAQGHM